jgi:hypothetical protein
MILPEAFGTRRVWRQLGNRRAGNRACSCLTSGRRAPAPHALLPVPPGKEQPTKPKSRAEPVEGLEVRCVRDEMRFPLRYAGEKKRETRASHGLGPPSLYGRRLGFLHRFRRRESRAAARKTFAQARRGQQAASLLSSSDSGRASRLLQGLWALYSTLRLIDDHLSRWAQRKFRRLRRRPKRARTWLAGVVRRTPGLLPHWRLLYANGRMLGAV